MGNLDGLNFYAEYTLEDKILRNVIGFLTYGLLEVGAFYNISKGQTNISGVNESKLYPQTYPGIANYRIYQSHKPDWIWERNIQLKSGSGQPIEVSGIYVNNVWYPTGTSVSGNAYALDFNRGRVIFDTATSGLNVEVPRSLRWVQIVEQDSYQHRQLESDWVNFQSVTGLTNIESKIYLPAVVVGLRNYQTIKGTNLGSRNKTALATLQFDIFTSSPYDRKKLTDICYFLETKPFIMFEPNNTPKPLNNRGEIINRSLDWKYLKENYPMVSSFARFAENASMNKFFADSINIYRARLTLGLELEIVVN